MTLRCLCGPGQRVAAKNPRPRTSHFTTVRCLPASHLTSFIFENRLPMTTAPPGGLAVATRGLTKRFGSRTVVDHVDIAIPAGSVCGFVGPNGAGKTTTIRMLLGLIRPTE